MLSAFLSPFRSGAEACAEEVALRLSDQFDITIVTARLKRHLPRKDFLRGKIPVIRIGCGFGIDKWLFPFVAPIVVWRIHHDVRSKSLSTRLCSSRASEPERSEGERGERQHSLAREELIIHAILETFAGLALLFCRFLVPSTKRILTLQTLNRHFLKCPIIRSAHGITAISSPLKTIAINCGAKDVTLIPNGIDFDRVLTLGKERGRILFVGRLESMKGIDTLLLAFAHVKGEGVHLRIVGDGSKRKELESLAATLGIASRVTFVGFVPVEHVYEEFAKAEIFCGLSRSEALGNVFLEAAASGCAVIGTTVGGIPDIVKDGITGILVPPDDAKSAAQAMQKLVDDAALRTRLSTSAREQAKTYGWDTVSEQYKKIYKRLT